MHNAVLFWKRWEKNILKLKWFDQIQHNNLQNIGVDCVFDESTTATWESYWIPFQEWGSKMRNTMNIRWCYCRKLYGILLLLSCHEISICYQHQSSGLCFMWHILFKTSTKLNHFHITTMIREWISGTGIWKRLSLIVLFISIYTCRAIYLLVVCLFLLFFVWPILHIGYLCLHRCDILLVIWCKHHSVPGEFFLNNY